MGDFDKKECECPVEGHMPGCSYDDLVQKLVPSQAVVWAYDDAPFTGAEVRELLRENEELRVKLAAANTRLFAAGLSSENKQGGSPVKQGGSELLSGAAKKPAGVRRLINEVHREGPKRWRLVLDCGHTALIIVGHKITAGTYCECEICAELILTQSEVNSGAQ